MKKVYRFDFGIKRKIRDFLGDILATLPAVSSLEKLEEVIVGAFMRAYPGFRRQHLQDFMITEKYQDQAFANIVNGLDLRKKGIYTIKTITPKQKIVLKQILSPKESLLFFFDSSGRAKAKDMLLATNQRLLGYTGGFCTSSLKRKAIVRVERHGSFPNYFLEISEKVDIYPVISPLTSLNEN
jgi:hypothetical protein